MKYTILELNGIYKIQYGPGIKCRGFTPVGRQLSFGHDLRDDNGHLIVFKTLEAAQSFVEKKEEEWKVVKQIFV